MPQAVARTRLRMQPTHPSAGLLALVVVSRPFSPEPEPADASAAEAVRYSNAKAGIWAAVLVFLGA